MTEPDRESTRVLAEQFVRGWTPTPEDRDAAARAVRVLMSCASPPLSEQHAAKLGDALYEILRRALAGECDPSA